MGDTVTVAQHPARAGKHGAVVRALVSDQVGRGHVHPRRQGPQVQVVDLLHPLDRVQVTGDRKSTRLNSSHVAISYAVFCLKKKKTTEDKKGGDTENTMGALAAAEEIVGKSCTI